MAAKGAKQKDRVFAKKEVLDTLAEDAELAFVGEMIRRYSEWKHIAVARGEKPEEVVSKLVERADELMERRKKRPRPDLKTSFRRRPLPQQDFVERVLRSLESSMDSHSGRER